ncbi:DM13 domain-containing protein [Euzebya tangerina]|uniref:DM13 domain-containing protein n=1 Tax=Euzebya tangerina TaxID=591198 RepID=UPI000E30E1D0|nr:DM13 domain-containing protein [Euzebya tangerina]
MSTTSKTVIAIGGLLALAIAYWLISPLFIDNEVDEAFPLSAQADVPDDMTQEEVEAEMEAAAGSDVEEVEAMPAGDPVATVQGAFAGADAAHQGQGDATIYDLGDGSHVLRFEDFEVTNGPDLHVYLAPLDANGVPSLESGAVDLGQLKGNIGDQNYTIPADFDLDQPLGVVIYCQPFHVTFATAALS